MRFLSLVALLVFAVMLALLTGCDDDDDVGPAGNRFSVSGTVTDSTGADVANTQVTVLNQTGNSAGSDTTDNNGFFTIGNLRPGTYTLVVPETVNGVPVRVVSSPFTIVNANVVGEDIILPDDADLTGVTTPPSTSSTLVIIVRDENGDPVDATATVSGMAGTFGPASIITVEGVTPTTHTVTVTDDGQTVTLPGVSFAGGAVTVVSVTLQSTPPVGNVTVSGTAQLLDGTPVSGLALQLWTNGASVQEDTTDDNGNFAFTDVAAGDYTIVSQQTLEGYPAITFSQPFAVTAGTDISGLVVIVPTGDQLINAAAPSAEDGTLVILGINENEQLVPVVGEVSGDDTTYGPLAALAINHVALGTHTVAAQAPSTGQTVIMPNIPIIANTITIVVPVFPGATP